MAEKENIFSDKPLPAINQRVKMLIDHYAGGSVKMFSELIKLSNSQKLNRVFNVDRRNGEYPIVSSDILMAIANMFSEVDINWVLTGKESMFRKSYENEVFFSESLVYMVEKVEKQSIEIGRLQKEIEMLKDRNSESYK